MEKKSIVAGKREVLFIEDLPNFKQSSPNECLNVQL